jgi:hypothetical protein
MFSDLVMPLAMAQRVQSRATKNSEAQKNKPSSVRKRSPRVRSPERQPSSIGRDLTGSNGIQRAERPASREKTGPGPWLSQAGSWLEVGSEGMVFGTSGSHKGRWLWRTKARGSDFRATGVVDRAGSIVPEGEGTQVREWLGVVTVTLSDAT